MDESGDASYLLRIARRAVAEDPLCDACVGRLVADRSFGLTNDQRGRALRTMLALAEDVPFEAPDATECWVCEGHTQRVDAWAERVVEALDGIDFATYQVGCRVPPLLEENDEFLRELVELDVDAGEPLNRELNREVGKRVGKQMGKMVDLERPDVVALLHIERGTVEVSINPAFVYGRYRKQERDIPQTEWPCTDCGSSGKQLGPEGTEPCDGCDGTGYRYDRSVEGLTAPHVVEAMDGDEGVFHGAGREDVDARMLGTGRPFVIEVKNPRIRRPDLDEIAAAIESNASGAVEVSDLAFANHDMVERVKELPASKTYEIDLRFDSAVSRDELVDAIARLSGATVEQETPNRVSHRRADLVRERTVYDVTIVDQDGERARLRIHGEGGLYIKELAHGDDGRTVPSLAGLLDIDVSVDSLDVVAVEGEEESFATDEYLLDT